MSLNYGEGSQQPCKHCNEEIGFAIWGKGPLGSWRHTESDTFYCDIYTKDTEAEPNAPECKCDKLSNLFCADCGTAEQLKSAGILGFNSPAEDFDISDAWLEEQGISTKDHVLEASAADIAYDERLNRLGEYNDL